MKSKHTPGPWHYDGYVVTADAGNPVQPIARVQQFLPEFRDESAANAHLIAAAPEMLAALKGIVSAGNYWVGVHNAAIAAIAKAEGK